jgi:FkbM family methyltransferase
MLQNGQEGLKMNGSEVVTVKFAGLNFETYLSSLNELREIYLWEVYEKDVKVEAGDVVVDAGTNVGAFTFKSIQAQASKILAFEPDPTNFNRLKKNLDQYPLTFGPTKIHCYQQALAQKRGKALLYPGTDPGGNSLLNNVHKGEPIEVDVTTLDAVMEEHHITQVDFIKMDVEGAAGYVLEGASKALGQEKLKIGAAIYHNPAEKRQVLRLLEENGFTYKLYNPWGAEAKPDDQLVSYVQGWKGYG